MSSNILYRSGHGYEARCQFNTELRERGNFQQELGNPDNISECGCASGWIPPIHRIAIGIQVFVQRGWVLGIPVFRIAGHEPTCGGIVVSGAEVVEARSESNCSPR